MARNITYKPGDHISAPVPAGTKSGQPLRIGGLNAIAVTDRAKTDVAALNTDGTRNASYNWGGGNPNGHASVWLEGAAEVVVAAATAPAFGDAVYIDLAGALTATATGNTLWGHCIDSNPTDNDDGTFNAIVRINN
jgi:predicted RecA/RadA family phage recombinase